MNFLIQTVLRPIVFANTDSCFFVANVTEGTMLNIDFEVITTGAVTGNTDITMIIENPASEVRKDFYKEGFGRFIEEHATPGDYK